MRHQSVSKDEMKKKKKTHNYNHNHNNNYVSINGKSPNLNKKTFFNLSLPLIITFWFLLFLVYSKFGLTHGNRGGGGGNNPFHIFLYHFAIISFLNVCLPYVVNTLLICSLFL